MSHSGDVKLTSINDHHENDHEQFNKSQLKTYAVALKKMKEKLEKYKTLTLSFKKTLESKTSETREKEKIISRLREEFKESMEDAGKKRKILQSELSRLRNRVDELESKREYDDEDVSETSDSKHKNKIGEPRWVLQRVIEPSGPGEGRVWCLVGYKEGGSSGWELEGPLRERTRKDYGVELSMPPTTPNVEEIGQLQDEHQTLKDDLKKLKHEFRRYRVRAELSIRQKEAALTKNREEADKNFGNKIRAIATDTAGDLKRARAEIEFMKRSASELKKRIKKEDEMKEKYMSENEDLRLELEEAKREKSEWQLRYENYVQEQRGRDLAEAVENAQSDKIDEYERLQSEFLEYKRRATALVQEREYALQEARAKLSRSRGFDNGSDLMDFLETTVTASAGGTKGQYLRNIVLQYLSTSDHDVRSKLEIAIGKMLNFTSTEMRAVKSANVKGWFF